MKVKFCYCKKPKPFPVFDETTFMCGECNGFIRMYVKNGKIMYKG